MTSRDYPRMLFHRYRPPVTVNSEAEERALGPEWSRTVPVPGAEASGAEASDPQALKRGALKRGADEPEEDEPEPEPEQPLASAPDESIPLVPAKKRTAHDSLQRKR